MNLLYSNLVVYVISILVFLAQTSRKLQFPTRTRVFLMSKQESMTESRTAKEITIWVWF